MHAATQARPARHGNTAEAKAAARVPDRRHQRAEQGAAGRDERAREPGHPRCDVDDHRPRKAATRLRRSTCATCCRCKPNSAACAASPRRSARRRARRCCGPPTDATAEQGEIVGQNAAWRSADTDVRADDSGRVQVLVQENRLPFELLQDSFLDIEAYILHAAGHPHRPHPGHPPHDGHRHWPAAGVVTSAPLPARSAPPARR
jgi:hypothetical protein